MERLVVTREEGTETAAGHRDELWRVLADISYPRQQSREEERQTKKGL